MGSIRALPDMNILVCYYAFTSPTRDAILDHIYCLERHSSHRVFYINAYWEKLPRHLAGMQWDAIVFHNTFLIGRSSTTLFDRICKAFSPLKNDACVKIAIAQDEHNHTDALCNFINEFDVSVVFTVAPTQKDRETIYKGHIRDSVKLVPCIAGYVEEGHLRLIKRYAARYRDKKDIDIGYRSFKAKARNGRVGVLKWKVCDVIAQHSSKHGLKADVSVEVKDILAGRSWLKFIARSRYQVGVEGGSSVLDRTGAIKDRCQKYEKAYPNATFEEIENACFPGQDGTLTYSMISPRVFELAMARCCQVLVEGRYNGIIQPNIHYIPIKEDFSDIDQVLASLKDEERREHITENAYRDLIASGQYTYRKFVKEFFEHLVPYLPHRSRTKMSKAVMLRMVNRLHHLASWSKLALIQQIKPIKSIKQRVKKYLIPK